MNNIKVAEQLIQQEIVVLEQQVAKLRTALQLLTNNEVNKNASEEPVPNNPVQEKTSRNQVVESDDDLRRQFDGYPVDGKHRDKVRFILSRYNRAISEAEFERIVKLMEGEQAKGTLAVFQRTLRGMDHHKHGELLRFQFSNNKTRFYIRPEWRTADNMAVLPEKMPVPNGLNKLESEALVNPTFKFKRVE